MQIRHYNEFLFKMGVFETCVLHHNHVLHNFLKALDFYKNFGTHIITMLQFFQSPLINTCLIF